MLECMLHCFELMICLCDEIKRLSSLHWHAQLLVEIIEANILYFVIDLHTSVLSVINSVLPKGMHLVAWKHVRKTQ